MLGFGLTVVKVCAAAEQTWTPEAFVRVLAGYVGAMASEDDYQTMSLMAELLSHVVTAVARAMHLERERIAALEAQVNEAFNEGISTQVDEVFNEETNGGSGR